MTHKFIKNLRLTAMNKELETYLSINESVYPITS